MNYRLLVHAMMMTCALSGLGQSVADAAENVPSAAKAVDVAPVWSGHSVGFCLLTHGQKQFVAYYDENRQMTVAQRDLDSTAWQYIKLDTKVAWDSHNYITMVVDSEGYLHVTGNMHVVPLIYFRSAKPLDAATLVRIPHMTGQRESKVTYPRFISGPDKELIFYYRDGSSGNGDNLFNIYDAKKQQWRQLLNQPLMDGQDDQRQTMNAYMSQPLLGPDGYFHVTWVWRNSPAAETCHDLSYIRSRDLIHWENARGDSLTLPIRYADNSKVVIDPIPVLGGIINGSPKIGFSQDGSLAVVYHKFDDKGNTQLYAARPINGQWTITQMTHWEHRWDFRGGGSLPPGDLRHGPIEVRGGKLVINVSHKKYGSGYWLINPQTFELEDRISDPAPEFVIPKDLRNVTSEFPGMAVRQSSDTGKPDNGKQYRLRWETLDSNRDRPRPQPWPKPTMLQVIELPSPESP